MYLWVLPYTVCVVSIVDAVCLVLTGCDYVMFAISSVSVNVTVCMLCMCVAACYLPGAGHLVPGILSHSWDFQTGVRWQYYMYVWSRVSVVHNPHPYSPDSTTLTVQCTNIHTLVENVVFAYKHVAICVSMYVELKVLYCICIQTCSYMYMQVFPCMWSWKCCTVFAYKHVAICRCFHLCGVESVVLYLRINM